jgi:hypothetical protein
MFFKEKRIRDEAYLSEIRELPCVVCWARPCDPHHTISRGAGGGDNTVVPICRTHHNLAHSRGQKTFWGDNLDRVRRLALDLYRTKLEERIGLLHEFRTHL